MSADKTGRDYSNRLQRGRPGPRQMLAAKGRPAGRMGEQRGLSPTTVGDPGAPAPPPNGTSFARHGKGRDGGDGTSVAAQREGYGRLARRPPEVAPDQRPPYFSGLGT